MDAKDYIICIARNGDLTTVEIMHPEGKGFVRVNMFNDEKDSIFIEYMSVADEHRKQGLGLELISIAHNIGSTWRAKKSCVLVEKGSWVQAWYERLGYCSWKDHETQEGWTWMLLNLTSWSYIQRYGTNN